MCILFNENGYFKEYFYFLKASLSEKKNVVIFTTYLLEKYIVMLFILKPNTIKY